MRFLVVATVLIVLLIGNLAHANHASYSKATVIACGSMSLECKANEILPFNQAPPDSASSEEKNNDFHEWAPVKGSVTGHDSVIEVRFMLGEQAIETLKWRHEGWQPFGLEIDVTDIDNVLEFFDDSDQSGILHKNFPDNSYPVVDTQALSSGNSSGLLIMDASKLEKDVEYLVVFKLKKPMPIGRVRIAPSFQISYNLDEGGVLKDNDGWDFFVLQSETYRGPTSSKHRLDWYITRDGRDGFRWWGKGTTDNKAAHDFLKLSDGETKNSPEDFLKMGRYDRLDQVCRSVAPNAAVEQFRNMVTGRITIYRTPNDQTGYRYANADCAVEPFAVISTDDGDGSGSGGSGSAANKKPNLRERSTYASYDKDGDRRVRESDKVFMDNSLWCQVKFDNNSSVDVTQNFETGCYLSRGRKFDGWSDAMRLETPRTKGLKSKGDKREYMAINKIDYPGWYNLASWVDVWNSVAESDEKDNRSNTDNPPQFQVWGRPSVSVSVSTNKVSYSSGEGVIATASFSNAGGAHPFGKTGYVDWYVDGTIVGGKRDRIQRENLRPGVSGKVEVATLMLPFGYGTHEIKVCFRYAKDDLVEEVDSADNCAVTTVTVPDPNPSKTVVAPKVFNFVGVSIDFGKEEVINTGEVFTPGFTVRNDGGLTDGTIQITYYLDGKPAGNGQVQAKNLPIGDTKRETLRKFSVSTPGQHVFKACFDDPGRIEESNEVDNCAEKSFTVIDTFDPNTPGAVLWQDDGLTPFDQSCGVVPQEPDFTKLPAVQSGDIGAVTVGVNRQRIYIPVANVATVGSGFWNTPAIDLAKVAKWCWNSNETNINGWGTDTSRACGVPARQSDGSYVVDIPNTPRASKGTWSVRLVGHSGDFWTDVSKWTDKKLDTDGHLRYGDWDFNRMELSVNAEGYYVVTARFGTPGIPGFWIPSGATLTGQAFWHMVGEPGGGIPGNILCDPATGKLSAKIVGATPGSAGRVVLGTTKPNDYAWQGSDWILPADILRGASEDYLLPNGPVVKSLRLDATYDAGAKRLTLTVPNKQLMPQAFWNAEDISKLTNKAVFQVWVTSGQARFVAGKLIESDTGVVTIAFEGIERGEGGNGYLVKVDGSQAWQNVKAFGFGSGIAVDPSGWYRMP